MRRSTAGVGLPQIDHALWRIVALARMEQLVRALEKLVEPRDEAVRLRKSAIAPGDQLIGRGRQIFHGSCWCSHAAWDETPV